MLNLTGRKEIKFLVSIQLTKGGYHNLKKKKKRKGYIQNPIISFTCSGGDECVPESSSSQIFVIASAGKVLKAALSHRAKVK